jgi:hypothetical protein
MLLKSTKEIKLDPPMKRIHCTSLAFNDTVVLLKMDDPLSKDTIVHMDLEGHILW